MKKDERHTPESKQKLVDGKAKNRWAIQTGLAAIITSEWIEYHEVHSRLNKYLSQQRGKPVDLEFISLSHALRKFEQSNPLEWKRERYGVYQAQEKIYVRSKN